MMSDTKVERRSEREMVATRTFDAPARLIFEAWSKAELFQKWWVPKSFPITLLSCEMDVRVGGKYRLVFAANGGEMAFFGDYLEVVPDRKIVWTNEEEGPEKRTISTVTFEERGGKTLVTLVDFHPSKVALDEAINSGAIGATPETFEQLSELLAG